jgi:hypothetical protein
VPPPVTEPTRSSRVSHATHRVAGGRRVATVPHWLYRCALLPEMYSVRVQLFYM